MKPEAIEFKVGEETLRGNLYLSNNPKKLAVLFLHGWSGHPSEDAAQAVAKDGYPALTFSFSGHNNSTGKLADVTRGGALKEAVRAYDFLKSKLPEGTEIIAVGSSYGSYIAALLSAERELDGISLRVPANYPDEGFDDPQLPQAPDQSNTFLTEWRKKIIEHDATRSLRAIHNFKGAVQILEAGKDEIVPPQTIKNYVEAISDKSKLEYHFMSGWTHSLGLDKERNKTYRQLMLNWLNKINEQI